jgi:DnaJ-like protein
MTTAYPLQWPQGWPRTPEHKRKNRGPFMVSADKARRDLRSELRLLDAKDVVVSTNMAVRRDGQPYAARRIIRDPGVAVYFTLNGRQLVMARDLYWDMDHNLRSITLAIAGIRAIERHGGQHMMEQAFAGFEALPAPKSCWDVLGLYAGASEEAIKQAYRDLAKAAHPDAGGSSAAMAELTRARDEALGGGV